LLIDNYNDAVDDDDDDEDDDNGDDEKRVWRRTMINLIIYMNYT
jgi:hypothetical protein